MTKDEALLMCLEYIEKNAHERKYVRHAIKAAIEVKNEPDYKELWQQMCERCDSLDKKLTQRTWVEIDDEDFSKALELCDFDKIAAFEFFEAKLKERNG
jgi:hypothetical protein